VIAVDGEFARGSVVACRTTDGKEIARGLVNYAGNDSRRISRHASGEIEGLLGFIEEPELIHRDNLVLLA
jgi:glutamate 5-kinase